MSTLTPRRPSRHFPVAVVIRQHRLSMRIAGALALAWVVALVGYTLWVANLVDSFEAGACSRPDDPGRGCDKEVGEYGDALFDFRRQLEYTGLFLMCLPGIVSAFVAGPMIARELESGTYKAAWTQSVTPARWLAAKLAVPVVLMLAATTILCTVLAWARGRAVPDYPSHWYDIPQFAIMGPASAGYTLLGITIGALTGLLMRRTVPAMSVAALVTGTVMLALANLRSSLWPIRTATSSTRGDTGAPADSWFLREGPLTSSGERLPIDVCRQPLSRESQCMAERDITGWFADYHPVSHFWPLQLVETGILLLLAVLAATIAFRVLRRRHA